MPSELFNFNFLDRLPFISQRTGLSFGLIITVTLFVKTPVFNTTSLDPDQTYSEASYLGQHYSLVPFLGGASHKWYIQCTSEVKKVENSHLGIL